MSRQRSCYAPLRRIALFSFLLLGAASTAFAQFDRGTISGTVKDAQGGIVPGATVTVTSTQTQQSNTTVTDATGFYTFPNLNAGRYELLVELSGFKKISRSNIQLDAAGALALDFTLETGALTEEVTVTAETTALQTHVAIRKSVEAKDIELLSFSGRNPIGVPALKAGVIGGNFNNAGFSSLTNGGFSINGGRGNENTITVDGAVAIRTRSAGATIGVQNADVIQEVQVLTANYMPEYGRASGGQIRFVTKSGSSRYSGNASYFYRDDSLQANTWTRNASPNAIENSGPAPFDYKQYGLLIRRPDSRPHVQGQAVLLRRAGVGQLLRRPDQHGGRADAGDAQRRLQPVARLQPVLQHAADHPRSEQRPAVPEQHHPGRTGCRRTASL